MRVNVCNLFEFVVEIISRFFDHQPLYDEEALKYAKGIVPTCSIVRSRITNLIAGIIDIITDKLYACPV